MIKSIEIIDEQINTYVRHELLETSTFFISTLQKQ
mgnify:CR=1 FL=1